MKIKIKQITGLILVGLLTGACASSNPKVMRKKHKKNCDCPSFSNKYEIKLNTKTLIAFNEERTN